MLSCREIFTENESSFTTCCKLCAIICSNHLPAAAKHMKTKQMRVNPNIFLQFQIVAVLRDRFVKAAVYKRWLQLSLVVKLIVFLFATPWKTWQTYNYVFQSQRSIQWKLS